MPILSDCDIADGGGGDGDGDGGGSKFVVHI